MRKHRRTTAWALVVLIGLVVVVIATAWSAIDYNAVEENLGEGETAAVPIEILLTGVAGGAMMIFGCTGLLLAWIGQRQASVE